MLNMLCLFAWLVFVCFLFSLFTNFSGGFNNYIVESVKPQKKVAQRIVEDFLVRHRASLPTEQLAMFDDLSSKLGGRIQR